MYVVIDLSTMEMLELGCMTKVVVIPVDEVGTHPSNREYSGLVISDVHSLACTLVKDGYNPKLVKALAGEVPPTAVGDEWKVFNDKLIKRADGFLAKVPSSLIRYVAAWGSHTTAAVRIYKFGALSDRKDLTEGVEGEVKAINTVRLLSRQPSLKPVVEHGLKYH